MIRALYRYRLRLLKQTGVSVSLLLAASFSTAVVPTETNFVLGMDVQGQRLNLYEYCEEGSVTCDNMLLVAPDLQRLWHIKPYDKSIDKSPYSVKLYPAKTKHSLCKHSLCKDSVTPCGFQGYQFEGNGIKGFIDPIDKKIHAGNEWTLDGSSVTYKESSTYLPLTSQATLINSKYATSDKALNKSYKVTRNEVRRLYGKSMEADLKKRTNSVDKTAFKRLWC